MNEMTLPSRHRIRALAVWGRARYFSVTEAPTNIEYLRVSGEETFCFFENWMPERGSKPRSPTFQAGSFNHCTSPHPLPRPAVCERTFPSTKLWPNVVLMLTDRLRRLPSIKTTWKPTQCFYSKLKLFLAARFTTVGDNYLDLSNVRQISCQSCHSGTYFTQKWVNKKVLKTILIIIGD